MTPIIKNYTNLYILGFSAFSWSQERRRHSSEHSTLQSVHSQWLQCRHRPHHSPPSLPHHTHLPTAKIRACGHHSCSVKSRPKLVLFCQGLDSISVMSFMKILYIFFHSKHGKNLLKILYHYKLIFSFQIFAHRIEKMN